MAHTTLVAKPPAAVDGEEPDGPTEVAITSQKKGTLAGPERLSRSLLWDLQRRFYQQQGVEAWSTGLIPFHITSTPYIAHAYAKMVTGYMRDCGAGTGLDPAEPFYIVELGAGHGRFGYRFLKRLSRQLAQTPFAEQPVTFVMTDVSERNLEFLQAHPRLQPFVRDGVLDFAPFDAGRDRELRLVNSGRTLGTDAIGNPLVLIANYVFDSIAQDSFHVKDGRLDEIAVSISSPYGRPGLDQDGLTVLPELELTYHYTPVFAAYYGDPSWNRLLDGCRARLADSALLFPVAALDTIDTFRRLAGDRLLLLSADKGFSEDEALLLGYGTPGITLHGTGCFSMMVDYRLIGEHFTNLGGDAFHPGHRHENLNVSACALGGSSDGHPETRLAYADAIDDFGPDDLYSVIGDPDQRTGALDVGRLMAELRLSRWDETILAVNLPVLLQAAPELSKVEKQEIFGAIRRVWDHFLPIGESYDLAFQLGALLYQMRYYAEAIDFFRESIAIGGLEPGTAYNLAACHYAMRDLELALERVEEALRLDPHSDAARSLRIAILAERNRRAL
ncbi:tetratricopeptide repeat protein [Microlunatus ginsengisoli]|uniref:SAM-dependent methyltransferase n=1 Tax=Microlunatus ginsengisoli TaxID=363863 RepID=A0ABP6ZPP4_9ACTN